MSTRNASEEACTDADGSQIDDRLVEELAYLREGLSRWPNLFCLPRDLARLRAAAIELARSTPPLPPSHTAWTCVVITLLRCDLVAAAGTDAEELGFTVTAPATFGAAGAPEVVHAALVELLQWLPATISIAPSACDAGDRALAWIDGVSWHALLRAARRIARDPTTEDPRLAALLSAVRASAAMPYFRLTA